ncbi:U3 small nucleolar RNA-associated protein Mpp10p [[Candida] railenensis]|uniref:U3 small nucleolar ribonucleoprotein protein MPP10 n=1 Tax=[Candida] railenensis TaxID=45579 RepID=A0A9P0W1B7_9ASCO|nr:U3 small nucleolar RNA-associated protein Mpp10p [[Candida] railenensis]
MSKIVELLTQHPEVVFKLSEDEDTSNQFNQLVKSLLDPITKDHSVLDEIYVEGLDASQVYGQSKMVLEGVGESLLFEKIPELKEKYGFKAESDQDEDEDEDDEDEEDEEESEDAVNEDVLENEDYEEESEVDGQENEFESEDQEENEANISDGSEDFQSAEENYESAAEDSDEATKVASDDDKGSFEPEKDVFGLNDGFFDIDEFNRQSLALENGDDEDDNDDEEEIDFFADLSENDEDDEEENMAYFDDFYEKPGKPQSSSGPKKNAQHKTEEDEEDFEFDDNEYDKAMGSAMLDLFDDEDDIPKSKNNSSNPENLSSFEKQQRQIQDEIAGLEAELVAEKKWNMKGEVSAKDRPQDSLLDDTESHNLEFERTAKPVPVITQDVTESLEDMIRRRIKEENFDDLPKRLLANVASFHNRQKYELSETKSSKSLADIYEDEYKGTGDSQAASCEISEELQKQHDEISELFSSVTHKLDSLCSAHFIPKPNQFKQVEIKVTDSGASASASINMEDSQPLHVEGDTALAPQEVYKIGDDKPAAAGREGKKEVQLKSGLSYSKDELSRDDKQRLRRASKRKRSKEFNQRKEIREQREKQNPSKTEDVHGNRKRARVGEVISTLSKAKNVTVIGKKGDLTDVKGHLKKKEGPKGSSGFKL